MTPFRPNRLSLFRIAILAITVSAPLCAASAAGCSDRRAQLAATEAARLPDWSAVTRYWKRYGSCEGDALQRSVSDAIGALLADSWVRLPSLVSEVRRQPKLRGFVLSHINADLPREQAARIRQEAEQRCPRGARSLCGEIGHAAARTLDQPA